MKGVLLAPLYVDIEYQNRFQVVLELTMYLRLASEPHQFS